MSLEFLEEVEAIDSIYGSSTLQPSDNSHSYLLNVPNAQVTLQISVPPTYPQTTLDIVGIESTGTSTKKGYGQQVLHIARSILGEVFIPGSVCLFDLLQEIEAQLVGNEGEQHTSDRWVGDEDAPVDVAEGRPGELSIETYRSEAIVEKKSTFLAHACRVDSLATAHQAKEYLLQAEKKLGKATHNILAFRVRNSTDSKIVYQDCDDDGETAAGGRLLHLLQVTDAWNIFLMVSRWYGGVKLGPDRFRLINQAARQALVAGGWTCDKATTSKV